MTAIARLPHAVTEIADELANQDRLLCPIGSSCRLLKRGYKSNALAIRASKQKAFL